MMPYHPKVHVARAEAALLFPERTITFVSRGPYLGIPDLKFFFMLMLRGT